MSSNSASHDVKQLLLITLGATAGGALGVFVSWFLLKQGMHAAAAPGVLLGLGAGLFRHRFIAVPFVCCLLALAVGIGTEAWLFPFRADESFGYFVTHLHQVFPSSLILIGVGGLMGFYSPYRAMMPAANK